ncbi:MAG: hypothetical protein ACXVUL_21725 [Solirubrobacteraceae bacterium]
MSGRPYASAIPVLRLVRTRKRTQQATGISDSSTRQGLAGCSSTTFLDTGHPLVFCGGGLGDAGMKRIGVIATHGLLSGKRWRALFSGGVREIWGITDTVLSRRRPRPSGIVSVAPLPTPVLERSGNRGGS